MEYFRNIVEDGIRESVWYRTAPLEIRDSAKIRILGVEHRQYSSMLMSASSCPALIVECTIGEETQKFSLLLNNTTRVEQIDLKSISPPLPLTLSEYLSSDHGQADILSRITDGLRARGEWGRRGIYTAVGKVMGFSGAYVGQVLKGNKPLRETFVIKMAEYLSDPSISQVPAGA